MKLRILVADRQIVRPGDVLAVVEDEYFEELRHDPQRHVYFLGDKMYSDIIGIVNVVDNDVTVIPLEGTYFPREGDLVIGVVSAIGITNWVIDIRAPYKAILNGSEVIENFNPIMHDLKDYLNIGDYVLAKIAIFDRTRDPVLTVKGKDLGKITEGVIVEVKPSRVPRLIGRRGSMLNILTSMTGCQLTVAQNGVLWIRCPDQDKTNALIKAVKLIDEKPHVRGLTEEVRIFLMKELGLGV